MAEKPQNQNYFSENDSFDIDELASLNDDISPEFIEQLQNKLVQSASIQGDFIKNNENEDENLFEEVQQNNETNNNQESAAIENNTAQNDIKNEMNATTEATTKQPKIDAVPKINIDQSIDDNFIKKYKAKLNKQQNSGISSDSTEKNKTTDSNTKDISKLTNGNIIEKPVVQEHINYNDSLDYLDDNIKYSKYVIYIAPENTDFIESLTIKERKNLINRILREQDDIAITKKRFNMIQAIIKHSIIAIITISISIPVIYLAVNTSLEASINNYRRSQTMFKTLYREKGKIKSNVNNVN